MNIMACESERKSSILRFDDQYVHDVAQAQKLQVCTVIADARSALA